MLNVKHTSKKMLVVGPKSCLARPGHDAVEVTGVKQKLAFSWHTGSTLGMPHGSRHRHSPHLLGLLLVACWQSPHLQHILHLSCEAITKSDSLST